MPTPLAPRFAEKRNLKTLSDLRNSGLKAKIVAGAECETRPFFAPGLKKTYGIDTSGIDHRPQERGSITDATLKNFDLVLLKGDWGDRGGQGEERGRRGGRAGATRAKPIGALSSDDLAELNRKGDAECQKGRMPCGTIRGRRA